MRIRDFPDARVYYPDDGERKALEELVEKGIVEYIHGGYMLTKKGVKAAKKLFKKEKHAVEG